MILKEIPTRDVLVGENIRSIPTSIAELVPSVQKLGILNPITVQEIKGGKYEVVIGSRRLAAAKASKLPTIPAIIRKVAKRDRLLQQLVENVQREDLHPLDQAEGLSRLLSMTSESQLYIARLLGKSEPWVSQTLSVLRLSKEEKDALRQMDKGPAKAVIVEAVRTKDAELRKTILSGRVTRRQAKRMIKQRPRQSGRRRNFFVSLPTSQGQVTVRFRKPGATRSEVVKALSEASSKVVLFKTWPPSAKVPIV